MASGFLQLNLASDVPGLAAVTDSSLVNPWGLSFSPTGPFWIAEQATGHGDVRDGHADAIPLLANVPAANGSGVGAPTGTVFNGTSGFLISANGNTMPGRFLFATEDGTISGWNSFVDPTDAVIAVDNSTSGASYKGLAIAVDPSGRNFVYAADFSLGRIDVFDSRFQPVSQAGAFQDSELPAGYAPFNVQSIGNLLVVAYAKQAASGSDELYGAGLGVVDIYTTHGELAGRLDAEGTLDAPWGIAMAPSQFGPFAGDLLIGNRGDGRINAFDPSTGHFLGQLNDDSGTPIAIPGLWGITFGNDHMAGAANTLFFSAGVNDETHGLFGAIQSPAQRGADTAGRGTFDPNAPGEVGDYPLPPANGPRLQSNTDKAVAISTLQPEAEGSLAMVPTLTVVAEPSTPSPAVWSTGVANASPAITVFVSTTALTTQMGDFTVMPSRPDESTLALNSFLNVDLTPRSTQERVPSQASDGRLSSTRPSISDASISPDGGLALGEDAAGEPENHAPQTRVAWTGWLQNLVALTAIPILWGYLQGERRKSPIPAVTAASKLTVQLPLQE